MTETPALAELAGSDLDYRVVRYGRVAGAEEAARRRGVPLGALIKTLVVRRGDGDYLLVLVPADRQLDWPKLRAELGVSRLSLPDATEAYEASGYERGTITPFGAKKSWPVIADERVVELDEASIGGGAHGIAVHLPGAVLVDYLGARVADVTRPG